MFQPGFLKKGLIVVAGSITYSTPGTSSFTVPNFHTLVIELWGGGGSGGKQRTNGDGENGTASSIATLGLTAGGGGKGRDGNYSSTGGTAGTATGGDINTPGNVGGAGNDSTRTGGVGANAPNGGTGGYGGTYSGNEGGPGGTPGAGGGGEGGTLSKPGSGAGSGGYVKKTYAYGDIAAGTSLSFTVGDQGGATPGNGGKGGFGTVKFTWS